MKTLAARLLAGLFALAATASAADLSPDIAIGLTEDRVAVDAGFSGADVTLFGAVSGVGDPAGAIDLVAVVVGPKGDFRVRALEKRGLFWLPGAPFFIADAPRFFASTATRPLDAVAPLPDQAAYRLGVRDIPALGLNATAAGPDAGPNAYKSAFIDALRRRDQYQDRINAVTFVKGALFRIDLSLPADTPVGDYSVDVYLYREGVLLARDNAVLQVNKVGLERRLYELANDQPVLYGLVCVAVSLLAGWIAGVAFRKP